MSRPKGGVGKGAEPEVWKVSSFKDFSTMKLGDGGANTYVSAKGRRRQGSGAGSLEGFELQGFIDHEAGRRRGQQVCVGQRAASARERSRKSGSFRASRIYRP